MMKTFLSFMNNMFYPVISLNNRNLLLLLRTVILVTSNQTTVQQLKIVHTFSIVNKIYCTKCYAIDSNYNH